MGFDPSNFLRQVKYCRPRILKEILKQAHEHADWSWNAKIRIQKLQLLRPIFFAQKLTLFWYGIQLISHNPLQRCLTSLIMATLSMTLNRKSFISHVLSIVYIVSSNYSCLIIIICLYSYKVTSIPIWYLPSRLGL